MKVHETVKYVNYNCEYHEQWGPTCWVLASNYVRQLIASRANKGE